jgi:DNA-directed RNA polymerase III subunit RPC1
MKEQVRENKTPKKIKDIKFTRFSSDEVRRASNIPIIAHELYQQGKREPFSYGPLDKRLVLLAANLLTVQGTSEKSQTCDTCGKKMIECEGHFGHISLELPVFHVGYLKAIYNTLQKICKVQCSLFVL